MVQSSKYAGFLWRVFAALIDFALVMTVTLVTALGTYITLAAACFVFHFDKAKLDASASLIGYIVGAIVPILYYAGFESSKWQATVGKKTFGLKVTDMNGSRISFSRALLRFFLKFVSGFLFGMAYLVCLITEHKQTLHDILIGTVVLKGDENLVAWWKS